MDERIERERRELAEKKEIEFMQDYLEKKMSISKSTKQVSEIFNDYFMKEGFFNQYPEEKNIFNDMTKMFDKEVDREEKEKAHFQSSSL